MKAVWNWYLGRSRLVKYLIVIVIIGTAISAFDGKTSYEDIQQGECFSDSFVYGESIEEFTKVDCSKPNSTKVVYVESFEGKDFPISWEQYALDNCPLSATNYIYPHRKSPIYKEVFACIAESTKASEA